MHTYAGLHEHSHLSLDGVGTIPQWVAGAKQKGLYGLAITDHGSCASMLELHTLGKKEKFPVLMGCEFYLTDELYENDKPKKAYFHITVLVKDFDGYKNICKLSTISYQRDHFYYKPRITFDELFAHKKGLMIGSGCLAGPICKAILQNTNKEEEYLKLFHNEFRDDYYLELQPSYVVDQLKEGETPPENYIAGNKQEIVNKRLIEFSKQYDIPMIITPDAHIIDEGHKVLQDIKLNSRSGGNWDFDQSHHLFTPSQLIAKVEQVHPYLSPILPELMANTVSVMDKGQFDMPEFESLLPDIVYSQHELYHDGDTPESLIIRIIIKNGRIDFNNSIYVERLKYEMSVLFKNGKINFANYFLLLEDVVRWCGANDVSVGPGRGSAAGALLCYALKITHLDPIAYNLSFERFINKARIEKGTFPDIDMDFSDADIVKKYLFKKYGKDRVAVLGVYQTLKTKSAMKDVLNKLRPEMSFAEKNALTVKIPTSPQGGNELEFFEEQLKNDAKLRYFMEANQDIFTSVRDLLGQSRQCGRHACAVIVSPKPLTELLPLWSDTDEEWVTQYSMDWCKKLGLIKFDFLGLNTLADISICLKLIKERHNIDIDPYNLPWNDPATLEAFSKADTETVFQFHTNVATALLQKIDRVDGLEDLSIITAIGRPGPMDVGMDKLYVDRKNGRISIEYPHEALRDILKNTYGIMVYQEQVMASVQILGGFSQEESDEIRRSMGSKNIELLNSFKERFIQYATANYADINTERAEKLWSYIESFSRYGFNKAHSAAYGLLGYISQYLRQHYPLEWYCAVFSNGSNDDRKALYPSLKKILVLPDINLSRENFYIKDDKIVISINFINQVGERSAAEIVAKQPFASFKDFYDRVNKSIVKKNVITNLIFAGAFANIDSALPSELIENLYVWSKAKEGVPKKYQNMTIIDQVTFKLEALPIQDLDYGEIFKDFIKVPLTDFDYILNRAANYKEVNIVGQIKKINKFETKKGDTMAFMDLQNQGKNVKITVWPEQLEQYEDVLKVDRIVFIKGKVNIFQEKTSVILNDISFLGE